MLFEKIINIIISQRGRLKNLSALIIINIIIMGLGFITKIAIANILGKEVFGQFAYGIALGTLGMVLVRFGTDKTLVRDLIHYPENFVILVSSSILLRLAILPLVILGYILTKSYIPQIQAPTLGIALIAIATTIISLDLQGVYDSWHMMRRHAIYNLVQKCFYFSILWLVITLDPETLSIELVGYSMFAAALIYLALQYNWAFKKINFTELNLKVVNIALTMGKNNLLLYISAIGAIAIVTINQIILKSIHGDEQLGEYSAAWQFVSLTMILLMQISRVGSPMMAIATKNNTTTYQHKIFFLKYLSLMLFIAIPIGILMFSYPELILSTVYKPEYITAAPAMKILGLYVLVYSAGLAANQYLISCRMEKLYLASVMIGGVLSIALSYMLIPEYNSAGAALALLISYSLSIGINYIFILKNLTKKEQSN